MSLRQAVEGPTSCLQSLLRWWAEEPSENLGADFPLCAIHNEVVSGKGDVTKPHIISIHCKQNSVQRLCICRLARPHAGGEIELGEVWDELMLAHCSRCSLCAVQAILTPR